MPTEWKKSSSELHHDLVLLLIFTIPISYKLFPSSPYAVNDGSLFSGPSYVTDNYAALNLFIFSIRYHF
jgi:hypothetical protein